MPYDWSSNVGPSDVGDAQNTDRKAEFSSKNGIHGLTRHMTIVKAK